MWVCLMGNLIIPRAKAERLHAMILEDEKNLPVTTENIWLATLLRNTEGDIELDSNIFEDHCVIEVYNFYDGFRLLDGQ